MIHTDSESLSVTQWQSVSNWLDLVSQTHVTQIVSALWHGDGKVMVILRLILILIMIVVGWTW